MTALSNTARREDGDRNSGIEYAHWAVSLILSAFAISRVNPCSGWLVCADKPHCLDVCCNYTIVRCSLSNYF